MLDGVKPLAFDDVYHFHFHAPMSHMQFGKSHQFAKP